MAIEAIEAMADAITRHEGWVAPSAHIAKFPNGSLSFRNNNPGNIVGVVVVAGKKVAGYVKYATYTLGREALEDDLTAKFHKYESWTLLALMKRYCPEPDGNPLNAGNNPVAYAQTVAKALGASPSTFVRDLQSTYLKSGIKYVPAVFPLA